MVSHRALNPGQTHDFTAGNKDCFPENFPGGELHDDGTNTATLIPVDSANKMLGSYLNSIAYAGNDTDLRSLSFDAATLRHYLTTAPGGTAVTELKVMFAHNLDYINAGNNGVPAGYRSGKLTLVMAGYDSAGNYVFMDNQIFNRALPCPENCPTGTAGNAMLPTPVYEQ